MSEATEMAAPSYLAHHFESLEKQQHAARLGMWVFLATEVLLFAALFAAYAVYRWLFHHEFSEASRGLQTWIGLVNTIVLVTSSFTVAMGLERSTHGDGKGTRTFFGLSVLLALLFLVFKYVEYAHHFETGELPGKFYAGEIPGPGPRLFFTLYYMITGLHGLHVVFGMTILTVIGIRAGQGRYTPEYNVPVELAGLYWHLVDLIWIFVFPLIYLI